jgi:hypothetical protein
MTLTIIDKSHPQDVYVNNHVGYDHTMQFVEAVDQEKETNVHGYDLYKCEMCFFEELR